MFHVVGGMLGTCWLYVGPCWAHVGPSWAYVVPMLGLYWFHGEPYWEVPSKKNVEKHRILEQ